MLLACCWLGSVACGGYSQPSTDFALQELSLEYEVTASPSRAEVRVRTRAGDGQDVHITAPDTLRCDGVQLRLPAVTGIPAVFDNRMVARVETRPAGESYRCELERGADVDTTLIPAVQEFEILEPTASPPPHRAGDDLAIEWAPIPDQLAQVTVFAACLEAVSFDTATGAGLTIAGPELSLSAADGCFATIRVEHTVESERAGELTNRVSLLSHARRERRLELFND